MASTDKAHLWDIAKSIKTDAELKNFMTSLSSDDVAYLRKKANPFKQPVVQSKNKYLICSIINYREQFHRRLLQLGLVRFMYQALLEYVPEDASKYTSETSAYFADTQRKNIAFYMVSKFEQEQNYNKLYSLYLKLGPKVKDLAVALKEKYNAVEEELDTLPNDVIDTITQSTKAELGIETTREEYIYSEQARIKQYLDLYLDQTKKLEFNFHNYVDAHYDALKEDTETIFGQPYEFEYSMIPLETVDNLDDYNKYKNKYAEEFDLDIICVKFNQYNILAPIAANRDKVEFYNKNTAIIQKMIQESQNDMRYGKELMINKMKKEKAQITPEFKTYLDNFNSMDHYNVQSLEALDKELHKDKHEPSLNEVEFDINVIKPQLEKDKPVLRGLTHRYHYNL